MFISLITGSLRQSLQAILVDILIIVALWFQILDLDSYNYNFIVYPGNEIVSYSYLRPRFWGFDRMVRVADIIQRPRNFKSPRQLQFH